MAARRRRSPRRTSPYPVRDIAEGVRTRSRSAILEQAQRKWQYKGPLDEREFETEYGEALTDWPDQLPGELTNFFVYRKTDDGSFQPKLNALAWPQFQQNEVFHNDLLNAARHSYALELMKAEGLLEE